MLTLTQSNVHEKKLLTRAQVLGEFDSVLRVYSECKEYWKLEIIQNTSVRTENCTRWHS